MAVHTRVLVLSAPLVFAAAFALWFSQVKPVVRKPWFVSGVVLAAALCLPQYLHVFSLLSEGGSTGASPLNLVQAPLALLDPARNLLLDLYLVPIVVPAAVALTSGLFLWRKTPERVFLLVTVAFWGMLYLYFSSHPLDALRYQYFTWPLYCVLAPGFLEFVPQRRSSRLLRPDRGPALALYVTLVVATAAPNLHNLDENRAISEEFHFIRQQLARLPANSRLLFNGDLEVPGHPPIRSPLFPEFLLNQAGLDAQVIADPAALEAASTGPDQAQPLVLYIGLQSYTVYDDEPATVATPRLTPAFLAAHFSHIPIATRDIEVKGQSPGPALQFSKDVVETGFYRLEP